MKTQLRNFVIVGIAASILAACAGEMMHSDPVAARKAAMRGYSGNMKAIGAFMKDGTGSAADVAKRARAMAASADKLKGWFPDKTSSAELGDKTRATPAIWAKKAAFDQAADIFAVYANQLAAAADGGNKGAIGAAVGNLGKSGCGGCHSDFRGPAPKKS